MSSQNISDDLQQVKSKRGPGPRGQRKQGILITQRKEQGKYQTESKGHSSKQTTSGDFHEKLSFKELLFERNNLKKHENSPKVDLWEEKDDQGSFYMIRMEIPGVNKDKINIDIKENQIVLVTAFKSGDKPAPESEIYSECRYGKIIRRVKVPNLIYDHANMKYENGVLKIETTRIPVKENDSNILDSRLDDSTEQNTNTQTLYSTLVENDQVKSIDFKNFAVSTGNWADDTM